MKLSLSSPTASRGRLSPLAWWPLAAILSLIAIAPLRADYAEDYLAALRQRGWHDTALEYLDQAEDDPLASADLLQRLDYERATTLAVLARQSSTEQQQTKLLLEAVDGFQRYAAEQADSPQSLQALANAGNLLTEQALRASNQADELPKAAKGQREQLQTTARDLLARAREPLQTLLQLCETQLQSIPDSASESATESARQQLEGKQAEAKFLLAKLDFEQARTYAEDSQARERSLKAAADGFAEIHEQYEDKLVGYYGRFYQGRSFQLADDFEQALDCYADLVDQPPIANDDFRRLVARAYRRRAECYLADNKPEEAMEESRQWLDESRGQELTEPEWLAVSYQLASAYEAQASEAKGSEAGKLQTEAKRLYREIAKHTGEFQLVAKAKIASDRDGNNATVSAKTFDEAYRAGTEALQQMNSAQLAARLAKENNPDSVASLTAEVSTSREAASRYFQQASELADAETDREQLATARYYLCWFHWEAKRFDEAAELGNSLAREFPESKYAPAATQLALASQQHLVDAARRAGESTTQASAQLAETAELLATRWPDAPEAASAINLLLTLALSEDRLSDAEQLVERLPAANRAAAQLRLGGALWTRYLQATRDETSSSDPATLALKQEAGEYLSKGYESVKSKQQASAAEATGLLYYAQWLLANGDAIAAIDLLEHPSVGPLVLAKQNAPTPNREAYQQETYKLALRAYVSVVPPRRERAQETMSALESAIGSGDDAQGKLIQTYVSLGLQLQQQISALTADGETEKAQGVATAFEDLLARITERAGLANDWKVQNWIAQTNLQLGERLQGADADHYFDQAAKAYQRLISKAEQDPKFAPSSLDLLATKKRLADCLLAQGKYTDAFQQYTTILQLKPNMLDLQQAAALALEQWGTDEEDPKRLEEAIRGALPQANKRNLVWGWLRIAKLADQARRNAEKQAASNPEQAARAAKYESLYFEARLHAARARFAAAQLATGADRQQQLATARSSLETMQRLYPDLGGPRWQAAYEALLEQMEQMP